MSLGFWALEGSMRQGSFHFSMLIFVLYTQSVLNLQARLQHITLFICALSHTCVVYVLKKRTHTHMLRVTHAYCFIAARECSLLPTRSVDPSWGPDQPAHGVGGSSCPGCQPAPGWAPELTPAPHRLQESHLLTCSNQACRTEMLRASARATF